MKDDLHRNYRLYMRFQSDGSLEQLDEHGQVVIAEVEKDSPGRERCKAVQQKLSFGFLLSLSLSLSPFLSFSLHKHTYTTYHILTHTSPHTHKRKHTEKQIWTTSPQRLLKNSCILEPKTDADLFYRSISILKYS